MVKVERKPVRRLRQAGLQPQGTDLRGVRRVQEYRNEKGKTLVQKQTYRKKLCYKYLTRPILKGEYLFQLLYHIKDHHLGLLPVVSKVKGERNS